MSPAVHGGSYEKKRRIMTHVALQFFFECLADLLCRIIMLAKRGTKKLFLKTCLVLLAFAGLLLYALDCIISSPRSLYRQSLMGAQ